METKIPTKSQKGNIFNTSIYRIIDQGLTQRRDGRLHRMIAEYNERLPKTTVTDKLGRTRSYRKGVIRGSKSKLAEQLVYLCLRHLEALRLSDNPSDHLLYRCYLESDRLPLVTNRQELANIQRANSSEACKSTIHNHLRVLQAAGIILKKRNTSRRRVRREDGTCVLETCAHGRGEFQLFLNKRLFHFHLEFDYLAAVWGEHQSDVEKPATDVEKPSEAASGAAEGGETTAAGAIGDQSVTMPSGKSLEQLIPNKTNTEKRTNNNSGKIHCTPSGVPSEPVDIVSELRSQWYKLERDSINQEIVAPAGEKPAAPLPQVVLDARERNRRQREAAERRRVLSGLVRSLLPEQERDFYLQLLQILLVSMLYPDIDRYHLQRIQEDLRRMLGLYWDLLPGATPPDTFRRLCRAIEMVHRYRQRHPDYRLYDPLSFLRMDYRGGFHTVVTEWLPREEFKLKMYAEKRSHLINWQRGQAYADDLFDGVVEALRTGLYNSRTVFEQAQQRLRAYLGRIRAADATKARIQAAFQDRFRFLYRELIRQAKEDDDVLHDPTWRTFTAYLDSINLEQSPTRAPVP